MKPLKTILAVSSFILLLFVAAATAAQPEAEVYFAPDGGVKEAVIKHIKEAKKSIKILSYYFSEPDIADALAAAAKRGVAVEGVFEKKAEDKDKEDFLGKELKGAGGKVFLDGTHKTMHNKVIIYDDTIVQTGSYNLRKKVDKKNAENVLFLNSPEIAAKYLENFKLHKSHADPF